MFVKLFNRTDPVPKSRMLAGLLALPLCLNLLTANVQAAEDFPFTTKTTVPLLAAEECKGAQNGFFTRQPDDPEVEKRRRYVVEQFLVVEGTGFNPQKTYDKWMEYEKTQKTQLYSFVHSFGLVALMFHQGKLSEAGSQRQQDWYKYANMIARESVGNNWTEQFQRYQLMDTFMRWRCEMDDDTKAKIKAYMTKINFAAPGCCNTANLKLLNAYVRYMASLAWPDAVLVNIAGDPTGVKKLREKGLQLYQITSPEWGSQPYDAYNTYVFMSLAQLAPERELATRAKLGFESAMAKTASVWMKGVMATYSLRDYPPFKTGPAGSYAAHWFYFGGKIPSFSLSRAYLLGAAVNYNLRPEILRIVTDKSAPLDTDLMLSAGTSRVHSHSYIEENFGLFSCRSATRDGTESTFTPGQTTPPGVIWLPKLGRSNFWLTLTQDKALDDPKHAWGNEPTNLVHAPRGQQWLQHRGTLLMVTDIIDHKGITETTPTLHQVFGSMPDPNTSSAVDTSCATAANRGSDCKMSTDGKPVYHLFYARDNQVMISVASSKPFVMFGSKRKNADGKITDQWNEHSFKIPLDYANKLANGVAIETMDYDRLPGATMAEKLANWKALIIKKSAFTFYPPDPQNLKKRSRLEYTDRLGNSLKKEYIWQGNAPFWRLLGWNSTRNPEQRVLEHINEVPVDHTVFPVISNRLVFQQALSAAVCPLYVRNLNDKTWLKIWDETYPIFTPNAKCKDPNQS